jgi:hypothetical protein
VLPIIAIVSKTAVALPLYKPFSNLDDVERILLKHCRSNKRRRESN